MSLYLSKVDDLIEIKEIKFKTEKEIQDLVSNNLEILFGLKLVKNEMSIRNMRLDTLAFDEQTKSFVIIEYKNTRSFSVIDQGIGYLSLMLNNKADFVLEYSDKLSKYIDKNHFDWSSSRVIFISPSFSSYQKESVNFKDLPIELWEIKIFENKTISLNQINQNTSNERLELLDKSSSETSISTLNREIKVYTEIDHTLSKPDEVIELYRKLKEYLLNIDDRVKIKATKPYIGFRVGSRNFCDIVLLKSGIKVWVSIPSGQLKDSLGIFRDVSKIGRWGNGDYETVMKNDENIEYIASVAKQAFNRLK